MTALYNEIDESAAATLRELIKREMIAPGDVITASIEDLTPNDLRRYTQVHFFAGFGVWSYALRAAGWPDDSPVWTGSCPCQPFSAAGKGGGFDDERHLWPSWYWLIDQCRPPIIFGEQVASKDAEPWLDLVQADLEAVEYSLGAIPFPSAGVGAPHIRDRLYWMADTLPAGRAERWAISGYRLASGRSGHGGVEYSSDDRSQGRIRGRQDTQWATLDGSAGCNGAAVGVAYADCFGTECWAGDASQAARIPQEQRQPEHDADVSERGGADNNGSGFGRGHGLPGHNGGPGPTNGLWSDADWLFCRDGKWRPVEPGTFPLAHGAPARVGRLRGYGNAINAEAARVFIESYLEADGGYSDAA